MVASSADPLLYYRPSTHVIPLQEVTNVSSHELTIIPYTADIHGIDYRYILEKHHYKLTKEISYRGGLIIEQWKKE